MGDNPDISVEQSVVQALVSIVVHDSGVTEGSSDMPVLWTGLCAGIALTALMRLGCVMTREERLELVRARILKEGR